jgi:hypothetical protein
MQNRPATTGKPGSLFGARPALGRLLAPAYSDLMGGQFGPGHVVYHPAYNFSLYGVERLHPFDAHKFSKVGWRCRSTAAPHQAAASNGSGRPPC